MPTQLKPVRRTCQFTPAEDRAFEDASRIFAARHGGQASFTFLCKQALAAFCQAQGIPWPAASKNRHLAPS